MNIEKTVSQCLRYFITDKITQVFVCIIFVQNEFLVRHFVNNQVEWTSDRGCECSLQDQFYYAETNL